MTPQELPKVSPKHPKSPKGLLTNLPRTSREAPGWILEPPGSILDPPGSISEPPGSISKGVREPRDSNALKTPFQDPRTPVQGLRTSVQGLRTPVQGSRMPVQGLRTPVQDPRTPPARPVLVESGSCGEPFGLAKHSVCCTSAFLQKKYPFSLPDLPSERFFEKKPPFWTSE